MNIGFMDFQTRTRETAIYHEGIANFMKEPDPEKVRRFLVLAYCALGLGEVGELQGKVKKILRDHGGNIPPEIAQALASELGDVMWYCSEMCTALGFSMADVAKANLQKLKDRKQRGVLGGSGDTR